MGLLVVRRRTLTDGRIETYSPWKNSDGYYVMADRVVDAQHNLAINEFFLKDIEAVAARLRCGGVSLRMEGDLTGQKNLISASKIKIENDDRGSRVKGDAAEDDPFDTFSEWSSSADERAYAGL